MKRFFLTILMVYTTSTSLLFAQKHNTHQHDENGVCATDEIIEQMFGNDRAYQEQRDEVEAWIDQYIANNPPTEVKNANGESTNIHRIPVVFHVMYATEEDNISKYQLADALKVLNEDYRRKNADTINTRNVFLSRAADYEVEFYFARVDPSGNCTEGINRVQTNEAASSTNNIKRLSMWDNKKYLNIWTVRAISSQVSQGLLLGYAFFPQFNQSGFNDGVLQRHDRTGSIGTSVSLGRTLTHEVGHYLNLHHPFRNGCGGGDLVFDTPNVNEANFGCNLSTNSCGGALPDMIENYMDYSSDNCQNTFTNGQKARSKAVLNNSNLRGDITASSNLKSVGVVDGDVCPPAADFFTQNNTICAGDTVKFVDASAGANPGSYKWYFHGGTPATSTERYPQVVYNNQGMYRVSLVVSNSAGTDSINLSKSVWVKYEDPTPFQSWLKEDFEGIEIPNGNWSLHRVASKDVPVEVTNTAAHSGTRSALIGLNESDEHGIFRLTSPNIDMTRAEQAVLEFKYAHAPKNNNSNTIMRINISTDCGKTWITRRTIQDGLLATAPATNNNFVPQSASEWSTAQVSLAQFAGSDSEILIMWEIENAGGNNLYIDDINMDVVLSDNTFASDERRFDAFPNPASENLTVELQSTSDETSQLQLVSVTGQILWQSEINLNAGKRMRIDVPEFANFPSGVYILRHENVMGSEVKKIIKQ